MTHVAVYGTLKRGESNHDRYLSHSEFTMEFTTLPKFTMRNAGFFPVLFCNGVHSIQVEIYRVSAPTLRSLDLLESVPFMYYRILSDNYWLYVGQPGYWNENELPLVQPVNGVVSWTGKRT